VPISTEPRWYHCGKYFYAVATSGHCIWWSLLLCDGHQIEIGLFPAVVPAGLRRYQVKRCNRIFTTKLWSVRPVTDSFIRQNSMDRNTQTKLITNNQCSSRSSRCVPNTCKCSVCIYAQRVTFYKRKLNYNITSQLQNKQR